MVVANKYVFPSIIGIALCITIGLGFVWVACSLDDSWLLLIVVFFPLFGALFPCLCGAYNFESIPGYLQETDNYLEQKWHDVSYFLQAAFLTSGFLLPFEMYRIGYFSSATPVYLSLTGETFIWASVMLYMFAFLYTGNKGSGGGFGGFGEL